MIHGGKKLKWMRSGLH